MKCLSYLQLKKNCARTPETPDGTRFALLGDCATQVVATAIRGYALEMNLPLRVFEADYDQIDAQLMDTGSEFYAFAPETVLLYRCTEKLYERFVRTPLDAPRSPRRKLRKSARNGRAFSMAQRRISCFSPSCRWTTACSAPTRCAKEAPSPISF